MMRSRIIPNAKDGKFVAYSLKDDENDGRKKPVDPELTENTTDALTAVLAVMRQVGAGKPLRRVIRGL